jgi:hypothetical protein
MTSTTQRLGTAAVAATFAFASAAGAAFAAPQSGGAGKSSADIGVEDCVVESSKDISYIQFLTSDSSWKDESLNNETFDLTTVEGIEDVESIKVKAGTTVETFAVACAADDGTAGGTGDQEGDTEAGDDTETGDANEGAVITLSGCTVESTKDISYIQFFTSDSSWKDESVNSQTFDLTTVEGIEDVESIEVKSSTTVEQFSISCGDTGGGTAATSGSSDDNKSDGSGTPQTRENDSPEETDAAGSAAAGEDTQNTEEMRTEDSAAETENAPAEDSAAETEETEIQEASDEDPEESDDSDDEGDEGNDS